MSDLIPCKKTLAITSHRILASDLNEHQTVYGGRLLEMLDGTASISATRLARCQTVTASLDQTNFITPFELDDSFCIETYVSGVGNRSIEVFAKIIGEHLSTGKRFLGLTAFLTFVAFTSEKLPQIMPLSAEEKYVCASYHERQLLRKQNFKKQQCFNEQLNLKYPFD